MPIDIARARAYIEAHGTPLEQARLIGLLDPQRLDGVAQPAVADLLALQNPDGGFPFGWVGGRPSALSTTAYSLYWLRDLHLSGGSEAQRGMDFLAERQAPRGIWREQSELQPFNPPLWSDPESTAADIYTTALCAGAMAVFADDDLAVDAAVNWLQTQQARDGLLAGFKAHSSWLAVPAFERIFGQETRATRRLIAGLGEILSNTWSAAMVAWLLQSLLDAGYTTRTALVERAWEILQTKQQPDGSFTVDDDDDSVTQTTLCAIQVARRFRLRQ
jgi:prenyltransferase beta subunit